MTSVADETKAGNFQEVIRVDREQLHGHLKEMVRESVEVTLNATLDAEADAQGVALSLGEPALLRGKSAQNRVHPS